METKRYSCEEIIEMLKKADSKVIQEFIANRIKEDENFRQTLGLYLETPSTKESNAKNFQSRILKAMKKAFDEAEDGWGYAAYSDENFTDKIDRLLKRIRKEAPSPELRISLQIQFLDNFDMVTNFEEYAVFEEYLEEVIEDFGKILNTQSTSDTGKSHNAEIAITPARQHEIRSFMCYQCLEHLGKFNPLPVELEVLGILEDFVMENFEDEFTDEIKAYLEAKKGDLFSSKDF